MHWDKLGNGKQIKKEEGELRLRADGWMRLTKEVASLEIGPELKFGSLSPSSLTTDMPSEEEGF